MQTARLARLATALLSAVALTLALLASPPPAAEAQGLLDGGLLDGGLLDVDTVAELPDAILDQLPVDAAAAGLAYAPRLVEVEVPTRADRSALVASGLDVTEHAGDDHVEVVLTDPAHEQVLDDLGLAYEVTTPDLIAQERERILADAAYFRQVQESPLPSGRTTYRVLDDFLTEMDQLAADNPDLVKRISLGESVEGRDLAGVEIGVDVNAPEDGRPVMLMFGAHHAREWPSAEAPMEFAHDLVSTYNAGDARTVDLLERTRVIIVPVSNPDGFDASRTSGDLIDLNEIEGGGTVSILATPGNAYKRKNCRIVDGQTQPAGACVAISSPGGYGVGIDLNRNYGALWGGPGADSQTPGENGGTGPLSPIYRGPAPFSEPETQAIRTLISTRQVTTLISNHTFSNLLLRPVGVEPSTIGPDGLPVGFAPDECFETAEGVDDGMQALGLRMAAQTGYSNQFGWELYDTTGTTEDYSYNATGGYGYTFEIGPEQFHPPFEEFVAEYDGTSESAEAVTPENAESLTTSAGRDCGDAIEPESVGGGLREAYFLALENAANTATHSTLTGTAPEGAEIGVTRTGTFPLWDGTPVEDTVTTSMVAEGGAFTYHVNPSTRPFVDSRPYTEEGDLPEPEVEVTSEEQQTGNTQPVGATEDISIEVPEGVDSLVVELSAIPPNDYDLELLSPDLVVIDSSANGNTDERVSHSRADGIAAGEYVARVTNFAAVTGWTMDITMGTLPEGEGADEPELLFSPRTPEAWTVTCTIDGEVVTSRDVMVDRGESRDLGEVCDPAAVVGGVTRLDGPGRVETAIAVSADRFPEPDSAGAVVLARGDDPNGFADALAGGPLAVERDAPLLITDPDRLRDDVAAEIDRVLPEGATVILLGGEAALAPAVEEALDDAGYETVRVAGADRVETAVAIADELGNPDTVLVATGATFPDALAASAAAGANGGAVLLTASDDPHPSTTAYLDEHGPERVIAVGGPAVRAYPEATAVSGADRYETAVLLAEEMFDAPAVAGIARGDAFPDALSGGAHVGALGGPMLLTPTASLDDRVGGYLCDAGVGDVVVYGGTAAVSDDVVGALEDLLGSESCGGGEPPAG
ncbi:M14 family zinc carboxypeptidase [Euzebya sp.]|uniref:M14 family zinc carboxypeptidase n=1 Tax=Euzebya sp. TaxID=1971409 RepID=UPI003512149B